MSRRPTRIDLEFAVVGLLIAFPLVLMTYRALRALWENL